MAKVKEATRSSITPTKKKSSSSGKMSMIKFSSMPKSKKASFKKYRGQGR